MNREQILEVFRNLAYSQGFYGRLLRDIYSDEEWGNEYLNHLESQCFKTDLDLILYIES